PPTRFNSTRTAFLPRVGALFDVTDWLSVYGSYAQGLRPVTFFNGAGGAAPKPEGSEQWEAGIKLNGPMGLSGTLDYFDLKRTGVPVTPAGSLTQRQSGEWRSTGFEADLIWQPTTELSVLASYAHIDARVSRDENPRLVNATLNLAPRDSGRLWGHYAFDGALSTARSEGGRLARDFTPHRGP
ncbi:MAG: iron complex outermembrane recepter protein, partial [Methylocystaceae bacterium]